MLENQKENIQKIYSYCKNYTTTNKQFPSADKIQKATEINIIEIKSILKLLVAHKYLKYKNKRYYLPEQKIKRHKRIIEPIKHEIKKTKLELFINYISKIKINLNFIYKIIIFAVFVNFCYIGIKYNYYGNMKFKDNFDALTSAIAFMLASIVFFKMFIDSIKKKIALLYFLIYFALFCYNTSTVLQYQFDKYQDKLYSSENIKTIQDKNSNEIIDKKIRSLETEITGIEKEKLRQENILNNLDKENEKYAFYYWNINGGNGFIKKLEVKNKELNKLFDEKKNLISNTKIVEAEKKKLLSGILLVIYLFFPAFVIELLASISLVLFFKNNT